MLLAPRFACDPVNEATSGEAFMSKLNLKVETALTTRMNHEGYGYTTIGILRWLRNKGELEEQRIFPQGYLTDTNHTRSKNTRFGVLGILQLILLTKYMFLLKDM